jgi:DNA-binding IscR family transcriptional regulator
MILTRESEYALRGLVGLGPRRSESLASLLEIAEAETFPAVEGPRALRRCLRREKNRNDATPYSLHNRLNPIHEQLSRVLDELTPADFIREDSADSQSRGPGVS